MNALTCLYVKIMHQPKNAVQLNTFVNFFQTEQIKTVGIIKIVYSNIAFVCVLSVRTHVCGMCVHASVYVYVCSSVHVHVCTHMLYMRVHACVNVTDVYVCVRCVSATSICVCIYVNVCVCVNVCICVYTSMCMCAYVYMYMCVYM